MLDNITNYLLKLETLNKSDIDEIAETGHLKRYDDLEKAKQEAEQTNNESEASTTYPEEVVVEVNNDQE